MHKHIPHPTTVKKTCRIQNQDTPRAGLVGRRTARRLGGAGPAGWHAYFFVRAGHNRPSCPPGHRGQTVLNNSSEEQTREIPFKPSREQNVRLPSDLRPLYHRDGKRSLVLAADQCTDAHLSM